MTFYVKLTNFDKNNDLKDCKNFFMVTFDIESMFPSIDQDQGLEACRKHLNLRKDRIFSTECILEAIKISLDYNLTAFNNTVYSQIKGTAMGPSNACDYADVAMSDFDVLMNSEN